MGAFWGLTHGEGRWRWSLAVGINKVNGPSQAKNGLEWGTLLDRADVNCPRLSLFRLHQRCTGGSCNSQMLTDEFQRSDVTFDSGLFWVRDSADCFGDSTAFWTTPR